MAATISNLQSPSSAAPELDAPERLAALGAAARVIGRPDAATTIAARVLLDLAQHAHHTARCRSHADHSGQTERHHATQQ